MIYLDYQATTPLAPEARAAMLPWLDQCGNPHSPHRWGREAKAAVEVARERVLAALIASNGGGAGSGTGQLLFTSGATEALNWAIKGSFARRPAGRNRVVTLATEHSAVLDTIAALDGAEAIVLPVERDGRVDPARVAAAIDDRTALVAAMLVNNEIGVVQDIAAIGALAGAAGAVMICDAVQGFGRVPLPLEVCDLVAITAHKVHGPTGIGALWLRDGVSPAPLLHGGGQEGGIRSGTLSPMLCAGFGAAVQAFRADDAAHVAALADRALALLGPEWRLNGSAEHRYRGNLNVRRDGIDAARLISEVRQVAFSAGSACASGTGKPSRVLKAIGLSEAQGRSSIRLGFGRYTTIDEIDEGIGLILAAAERQRRFAA